MTRAFKNLQNSWGAPDGGVKLKSALGIPQIEFNELNLFTFFHYTGRINLRWARFQNIGELSYSYLSDLTGLAMATWVAGKLTVMSATKIDKMAVTRKIMTLMLMR